MLDDQPIPQGSWPWNTAPQVTSVADIQILRNLAKGYNVPFGQWLTQLYDAVLIPLRPMILDPYLDNPALLRAVFGSLLT